MIELEDIYCPEDEEYLPFQKAGITEMVLRKNVLLGDEMGLGKTIQIIGYMNLTRPTRVLIVCPNYLRPNWVAELRKWLDPTLLEKYDGVEECTSAVLLPSDLTVASYEGFTKWSTVLVKQEFDLIVFDEAHYLKNRSAKRTRAAYLFHEMKCKKIMATGTPICNYPYEVFPLIHFLDQEQWPSAASFERRYCPYQNRYGYHLAELQDYMRNGTWRKVMKKVKKLRVRTERGSEQSVLACNECVNLEFKSVLDAQAHMLERNHVVISRKTLSDKMIPETYEDEAEEGRERAVGLMIRRLKKEVLPELPKKRRQVIELPAEGELLALVEKENEMYQKNAQLMKEMEDLLEIAETDSKFEANVEQLVFNKQYFFTEMALIAHALARAKVPYVIEHLEDLFETLEDDNKRKEKVVLFIHHRDVAEAILGHFGSKAVLVYGGMDLDDAYKQVDKFNKDPGVCLFIGSIRAAGVGLNLQVSSNIVFAEEDWTPGVMTQAEDRCHRIGQEHSVLIQHLVAENSMDSKRIKRWIAKQRSIRTALDRPLAAVKAS